MINQIYLFDDMEEKYLSPSKQQFIDLIACPQKIILTKSNLLSNLRQKILEPCLSKWDVVVYIGRKGKFLFHEIKEWISYDFCVGVRAHRLYSKKAIFQAEKISGADFKKVFHVSLLEKIPILKKNAKILLIDDIVYTGDTLKEVMKLFDTKNNPQFFYCSYINTDLGNTLPHFSGFTIPGPISPIGHSDVYDLRDFFDAEAIRFDDGSSLPYFKITSWMQKYIFGRNFSAAEIPYRQIKGMIDVQDRIYCYN